MNPPTSFLTAQGAHPGHRASGSAMTSEGTRLQEQTPLKLLSWEGSWGTPDPTNVIWKRRLVHLVCCALGPLEKVMDALCLGKLRQKQQTRFALSCARNQGLNMAIKDPLSSLLPLGSSCSCPQLPEELVPPGSMSWGKNAESLGALRPCRNHLFPGRSTDLGLSVPAQAGISGSRCLHRAASGEACRGHSSAAR